MPNPPTTDDTTCLKFGKDVTYLYEYKNPTSYDLTATKGTISYKVSDGGSLVAVIPPTPIADMGAITGTAQVPQTLTAGAITPAEATVTYQWQAATTAGGVYSDIAGAISSACVLSFAQIGKYIKVIATGTSPYSSAQTSTVTVIVTNPNWIIIGTQTWAKANLNVGTRITGVVAQTNNVTTEKYCYNNLESNCTTYGALYQWDEAMRYMTTEGVQGLCPFVAYTEC